MRASDLTLGSAGSIGESAPDSQPSTPNQLGVTSDKNITSFIAPYTRATDEEEGPIILRSAAWRGSGISGISNLSEAQVFRAQNVVQASYTRYGHGY